MAKKILLINPNFKYFPGAIENLVNYRKLPLGLAYIASYLKAHKPIDISICDASLLNISDEDILQQVKSFKPDIIGISVHTPTVKKARYIAYKSKYIFPDVLIVFGGPHVTALPFENLDVADVSVIGEGEQTFYEIVENISKNAPLDEIKGIAFRKNGQCVMTQEQKLIADLDSVPFPARDLFSRSTYQHIYPYSLKNPFYDTIITSRGCSFNCNFCMSKLIWKGVVRYRSLDNVFEEIDKLIKERNISLLAITDDNFSGNPERAIEFCQKKKKYFPKLKWICHSRADCLSESLLAEMKSAGCLEVQIGVESGDDSILNNCNKRVDTSTICNAFKLLKKFKINQWATFIIGNEGETKESVEKTINFAKKLDCTYCSFLFLSPYPGTKCFDNFLKKDYIKNYEWEKYQFHADPVFETECLSKKMLKKLRKKAYRKFYLRPKILARCFYDYIINGQFKTMFSNFLLLMKLIFGL